MKFEECACARSTMALISGVSMNLTSTHSGSILATTVIMPDTIIVTAKVALIIRPLVDPKDADFAGSTSPKRLRDSVPAVLKVAWQTSCFYKKSLVAWWLSSCAALPWIFQAKTCVAIYLLHAPPQTGMQNFWALLKHDHNCTPDSCRCPWVCFCKCKFSP